MWTLVGDEALRRVLPPERTVELFVGRPRDWDDPTLYPKIDLYQSLDLLNRALRELNPQRVYFRSTVQTSMPTLVVHLKSKFPHLQVIHETYDWGSFIEDHRLRDISLSRLRTQKSKHF